jgi:hypothetical protein
MPGSLLNINVRSNIAPVLSRIASEYEQQIPFAIAFALTRTAQEAKQEVDRQLPEIFKDPTPFTLRAIGISRATKQNLASEVFIKDIQAKYLRLEITGGERTPAKRALVLPTAFTVDPYGNLPRNEIKTLLRRKDVFSGRVRGIAGIWLRARFGVTLLVAYEPRAKYQPIFHFADIVREVVAKRIKINMQGAIGVAIATAK